MVVSLESIKKLRELTGVGMSRCKAVLEECGGNIESSIAKLRVMGEASAKKRETREANEGAIFCIEEENALSIVEVNAETDFVVKNAAFQRFSQEIAQAVLKSRERDVAALLAQPTLQDSSLSFDQYRCTIMQSLGENIQVRRVALVEKKEGNSLAFYRHMEGRAFSYVELEGSSKAMDLAKEIAIHIIASLPEYLSREKVPREILSREREIAENIVKEQYAGKPEAMIEKILEGRVASFCKENCLVLQPFVKNPNLSIQELIANFAKEHALSLFLSKYGFWKVGGFSLPRK